MKTILSYALVAALAFAGAASVVSADPKTGVVLPVAHKDQSGFYSIQLDNPTTASALEPFAALSLEVYNPNEQLLRDGTSVDTWAIHAALYTSDANFVVLTGFVDRANPTVVDVEVYSTVLGETVSLGTGQLRFDPERDGNASLIDFDITITAEAEGVPADQQFELFGQRSLSGKFRRNSDRPVFGCHTTPDVSPLPPLNLPTAWCHS